MTKDDADRLLYPLIRYYRHMFCLQHWEIKTVHGRLDSSENMTTKAEVFIEPSRWIARITFDVENIKNEVDLADTVRHEMLHVLAWPFQQFHNYAFGWVPRNADDALNHMKSSTVERLMGNLENMLTLGYQLSVEDDIKAALENYAEGESPHTEQ